MLSNISEQNISIRKLTNEEILAIYTNHSVRHFPEEELKPVSSISRMLSDNIYIGYGIFARSFDTSDILLCYAFFTVLPKCRNILLDYFAVMEEYRSLGIGSLFLKHFISSVSCYDGILIEVENPDYAANADELSIRRKRIGFYERNGAIHTNIIAEVFAARYRLLFLPILSVPSAETLYADFDKIYQHMVSQENYNEHINIRQLL